MSNCLFRLLNNFIQIIFYKDFGHVQKVQNESLPPKGCIVNDERCFKLLFDNTKDAIFITSSEGRIIRVNPAGCELAGMSENELQGSSIHALFDSVYRETSMRQLAWLRDGGSVEFSARLIDGDGESHDVEVSARLISGGDDVIINVIRDITALNRLIARAARSEKIESLGVLAGGVAHDFEHILEAIIGSAEMAMENLNNPREAWAYLDIILKSAERAGDLTRRLMDYAGKGEIRLEAVDLNRIALEVIASLEDSLPESIIIRTEFEKTIGAVWGDFGKLKTAVINLILNARDAMPDGGEILIATRNFSADERFVRDHAGTSPGANVELVVADSGRGINPEILPRIFDPFYTTKERKDGRGLGLALTHAIITSLGGYVDIDSKPNRGTTIRILLPIIEADAQPTDIGAITRSGKNILIIDDERIIQKVLSSVLSQLGYTPFVAHGGVEALEFLARGELRIDAVFLDMVMPGLTGRQTFEKIRELWPELPVIVVTGYADERETIEMLDSGINGFIDKPFKAGQIAHKLAEIFGC